MTLDQCKRHLIDVAAAWLSASSLDDLNVPDGLSDTEERRWERAKREAVTVLYRSGPRRR